MRQKTDYHIGYKEGSSKHSTLTTQGLFIEYPGDVCNCTQLMFFNLDMINHYQIVGDTKAPLLRVTETNFRLKNSNACTTERSNSDFRSSWSTILLNFL